MAAIKTETIMIGGMTCVNCENKIEKTLSKTRGIVSVKVKFSSGTALVKYNEELITHKEIVKIIESLDYTVKTGTDSRMEKTKAAAGTAIVLFALYIIVDHFGGFNLFSSFPLAEEGMGYGMLFIIGLLTSIHCVAMCGGINLSQCIPQKAPAKTGSKADTIRPSILYNLGRVVSYTIVGGIVGAVGSVVSFSGTAQGIVQLAAGIFMVIMGLNMLGTFPFLRKLNPHMPKIFAKKINEQKNSKSPLYVGLLNGLMPCGPLQAMQLYALSTGSPVKGALSMLIFSLGTVPLMFGLGALSSVLTKKFSKRLTTASAVLVVILGVFMLNNGAALSGFTNPFESIGTTASDSADTTSAAVTQTQAGDGSVQVVNTTLTSRSYEPLTVTKDVPVKWIITADASDLTSCNSEIVVPKYDIDQKLTAGENVIEFTPTETGVFAYSCWMGMIRSKITVVEADASTQSVESASTGTAARISTDQIAVAEVSGDSQSVTISMNADGFSPAVIVLQEGIDATWTINASGVSGKNETLSFPEYDAQVTVNEGANQIQLYPTADFDFYAGDGSFYGYVKVVDDINTADLDAIKAEVSAYTPASPDTEEVDDTGIPNCCG